MFYRFYVLADSGPCSHFNDPIFKSDVFQSDSLLDVYVKFSSFLIDFQQNEFPLADLVPDRVYVVYGEDPELCPYRSTNKRLILFAFSKRGSLYRTLGCDHL